MEDKVIHPDEIVFINRILYQILGDMAVKLLSLVLLLIRMRDGSCRINSEETDIPRVT